MLRICLWSPPLQLPQNNCLPSEVERVLFHTCGCLQLVRVFLIGLSFKQMEIHWLWMNWLPMGKNEGERQMGGQLGQEWSKEVEDKLFGRSQGICSEVFEAFGGELWVIQFLSKHWKRLCWYHFSQRRLHENVLVTATSAASLRTTPCQWGRKKCCSTPVGVWYLVRLFLGLCC